MSINTYNGERRLRQEDYDRLKPVTFGKKMTKKLNGSACVPSNINAYSLCIGYIKNWFISKFPEGYFKSVYVEGKHVFEELKKTPGELVKKPKPALSIVPQPDWSFDNENLNWSYGNMKNMIMRTSGRDVFFRDINKNLYMSMVCDLMLVNFTFRIKVNTRAKQVDLEQYIQNVVGTDSTEGSYVTMDFHFPYDLALQIAKDAGFTVKDNTIDNVLGFLGYLNSHSNLPFMYKIRNINGRNEFFVRQTQYVHIRYPEAIDLDDGERQNHISSNFILTYEIQVRFPAPKFYKYFSYTIHDLIKKMDEDGNIKAYITNFSQVPLIDEHGWEQYFVVDYEDPDTDKPLEIDMAELFKSSDILKVIEFTTKQKLSPALYMDIKLFNANREFDIRIDWDNFKITTIGTVLEKISRIAVYLDKKYVNEQIIYMKDYYSNRLE